MNVDELKAGPKLNELVAQKVMKWHRSAKEPWDDFESEYWVDEDDCFMAYADNHKEGEQWTLCWSPSTDIAAAWTVVEKLRLHVIPFGTNQWAAANRRDEQGWYSDILVWADTAPLAICLAAIEIVEATNDQENHSDQVVCSQAGQECT